METLKQAALFVISFITFGVLLFSFATISLVALGIAGVLAAAGFLARPLLPKAPRKPCIIDA
jgi:hypothetical protein